MRSPVPEQSRGSISCGGIGSFTFGILSAAGLVLGTLFFAASLTPTLLPRTYLTQGVLSGCSFAIGYGIGVLARWLAEYLELPKPKGRILRIAKLIAAAACLLVAAVFLWRAAEWQNSIRKVMALEPVDTSHPLEVGLVALVTFLILIVVARIFQLIFGFVSTRLRRFVPARISHVIGIAVAVVLFWSVIDGVLFRFALHVADSSFREFDALIEPERAQPADPMKTGSEASLLRWDELGRAGREYIVSRAEKPGPRCVFGEKRAGTNFAFMWVCGRPRQRSNVRSSPWPSSSVRERSNGRC